MVSKKIFLKAEMSSDEVRALSFMSSWSKLKTWSVDWCNCNQSVIWKNVWQIEPGPVALISQKQIQ